MNIEQQYPVPSHMNEPVDFKIRLYMPSVHHIEQLVCALARQFALYQNAGRKAEAQGEPKEITDLVLAQAEQVMYLLQQLLPNLPPEHKVRIIMMASSTINPPNKAPEETAPEQDKTPSSESPSDRPT